MGVPSDVGVAPRAHGHARRRCARRPTSCSSSATRRCRRTRSPTASPPSRATCATACADDGHGRSTRRGSQLEDELAATVSTADFVSTERLAVRHAECPVIERQHRDVPRQQPRVGDDGAVPHAVPAASTIVPLLPVTHRRPPMPPTRNTTVTMVAFPSWIGPERAVARAITATALVFGLFSSFGVVPGATADGVERPEAEDRAARRRAEQPQRPHRRPRRGLRRGARPEGGARRRDQSSPRPRSPPSRPSWTSCRA